MEGGNGLLRSSNKILVVLCVAIDHLVELLVEIFELGSLPHVVLEHELRCLQGGVSPLREELQAVVDQGLVQENTPLPEEIAAVTDNLGTSLGIVSVQPEENLVVGKALLLLDRDTLRSPCALDFVVVFVVADRDRIVDDVSNFANLGLQESVLLSSRIDKRLLLLL